MQIIARDNLAATIHHSVDRSERETQPPRVRIQYPQQIARLVGLQQTHSGISMLRDRSGEENLWTQMRQEFGKLFLVHRLDKGTSGVLLVATQQDVQSKLTRLSAQRAIAKYYIARVVKPFPRGNTFLFDLPLCKARKSRYRVAAPRATISQQGNRYVAQQDRDGLPAQTRVRAINAEGTRLLVKPATGRTHQIRVHLGWCGYPLRGDKLYNGQKNTGPLQAERLHLHCHHLVIPGFGTFSAPSPF